MKGVWEEYFSESEDANWEIVLPLIYGSIAPIDIRVVNSEGGSLDYDQHKQHGLRIIAIGGNCLSRGLTLEGLMVSYFRRTTKMYDTLLQMGRWFGYRPNYADLCKIWITEEATEWFEAITESYIELKNDVRTMISQGLSPKDFGMKVRTHPGALLPTARNKMRSAKTLSIPVSIAGRLLETPRVLLEAVGHNEGVMRSFVSKLDSLKVAVLFASRRLLPLPNTPSFGSSLLVVLMQTMQQNWQNLLARSLPNLTVAYSGN